MSQAAKLKRSAIYDDVLKLPDNVIGEIIDGELLVSPRPSPKHSVAASSLLSEIHGPFQFGRGGPGGWWILTEPEIHLGSKSQQDILVPDLGGWRKTRLPKIPDESYLTLVPDWVCEVLSPTNAQLDRAKKVPKYGEYGVKHLWLVDPLARTLEVLKLENNRWVLFHSFAEKDKFRAEPFEAMEFDLSNLWAD